MRKDVFRKGMIVGIIFLFVGASFIPNVIGDNPVFTNTIVVPDDYPTIQQAIDNASDGDRIEVRAGTYYENVIVDKSITLLGENKSTTVVNGGKNDDVIYVTANDVIIKEFKLTNSKELDAGICVISKYNIIKDVISTDNYFGITLEESAGCNNISYNIITNCTMGLKSRDSSNNYIGYNIFDNISELAGILLERDTHNNIISHNELLKIGIRITWSNNNIICSNTITDSSGIFMSNSSGDVISENNILECYAGIAILYCDDITISNNLIKCKENNNVNIGINAIFVPSIYIDHNYVENFFTGISLQHTKNQAIISCNTVTGNYNGIATQNCNRLNLSKNKILNNSLYGCLVGSSKNGKIYKNHMQENLYGLALSGGSYNRVRYNNFKNNIEYDAIIGWSFLNKFDRNYYSGWGGAYFVFIPGILPAFDWNPEEDEYIIDC